MCSLCCVGAAAAADSDRQVVPEKAHRDPGAGAAGVKPGHTGEKSTLTQFDTYNLWFCQRVCLEVFVNPHHSAVCFECCPCPPPLVCVICSHQT